MLTRVAGGDALKKGTFVPGPTNVGDEEMSDNPN
jgi:hypothetical protein